MDEEILNSKSSEVNISNSQKDKGDEKSSATIDSIEDKVYEFNRMFSEYRGLPWDKMPDIELYMDQVVTFLDRYLGIYKINDEDKIITPSMINNYTKDRVVPRAESKKYSREHIALILMVVSLKKVLSMPDLTSLLNGFEINKDNCVEEFYNKFLEYQNQAIFKSTSEIEEFLDKQSGSKDSGDKILKDLALELSVQSHINCILAEHILNFVADSGNLSKPK